MFVLFILHHALNGGWYKSLFRGKYTPFRVFQIVVDALVLLDMLGLMVSGVILSNHVFDFLPHPGRHGLLPGRCTCWPPSGGSCSWALHLGLHWNVFLGMARKAPAFQKPSRRRDYCAERPERGRWRSMESSPFSAGICPHTCFCKRILYSSILANLSPCSTWIIWLLWGCSSFWPTLRQSCCGKGFISKRKNDKEESLMKKNLGNALALYPTPWWLWERW